MGERDLKPEEYGAMHPEAIGDGFITKTNPDEFRFGGAIGVQSLATDKPNFGGVIGTGQSRWGPISKDEEFQTHDQ
jgi:hypothetical protein